MSNKASLNQIRHLKTQALFQFFLKVDLNKLSWCEIIIKSNKGVIF